MASNDLNQLPKPDIRIDEFGDILPIDGRKFVYGDFYTAEQMRQYAALSQTESRPAEQEPVVTMNNRYGDDSDHECCIKCGYCKVCGDCKKFGCGDSASTTASNQTEQPNSAPSERDALQVIAQQLQWWLDFNERGHNGSPVTDDTHVIPPEWPTRGVLKNWIAALQHGEGE